MGINTNKLDLCGAARHMEKAKEEMIKAVILLSPNKSFKGTVKEMKEHIGDICTAISLIDGSITTQKGK